LKWHTGEIDFAMDVRIDDELNVSYRFDIHLDAFNSSSG
jgi:hypothetical protein